MLDVTYRDILARYDLRMLLRICFDDPPNSHNVHSDWELGESPILNAALEDAKGAVKSALWYWQSRKLNKYADRGDFRGLTKAINGGYNGLEARQKYWERAKKVFVV